MIEILGINYFIEAMFYYLGRANNDRVEERLKRAIKKYPENKKLLENTVKPAKDIEKLLDSKLSVDEALVSKYFRKADNAKRFANSLAFAMLYLTLVEHTELSRDEMIEYLINQDADEITKSFCIGLMDNCETVDYQEIGIEEMAQYIEKMDISFEDKWKFLNAGINFKPHIKELISLLIPAVDIIKAAAGKYESAVEEFRTRYASADAKTVLDSNTQMKLKTNELKNVKIIPLIMAFDQLNAVIVPEKDDGTDISDSKLRQNGSMIMIGIADHLTSGKPKEDTLTLGEKLRILSDNSRLEILFYLCSHKAYGQELSARFNLDHSTISYHLSKLLSAGFVNAELINKQSYYSADKEGVMYVINELIRRLGEMP